MDNITAPMVAKRNKKEFIDLSSISPFELHGRPSEESKPYDPEKEKEVDRFIEEMNKARREYRNIKKNGRG
jgi:hypothetical protein